MFPPTTLVPPSVFFFSICFLRPRLPKTAFCRGLPKPPGAEIRVARVFLCIFLSSGRIQDVFAIALLFSRSSQVPHWDLPSFRWGLSPSLWALLLRLFKHPFFPSVSVLSETDLSLSRFFCQHGEFFPVRLCPPAYGLCP